MLIDEADDLPSSAAFSHRFGSLVSAYRLIGYDPGIDYSFIEINRKLRKEHPQIVASVIRRIEELGASANWDEEAQLLHVNSELRVSIVLCRHCTTGGGSSRWVVRLDEGLKPDITIAVRMDATNEGVRDYYLEFIWTLIASRRWIIFWAWPSASNFRRPHEGRSQNDPD
jgi:hypothetical protein